MRRSHRHTLPEKLNHALAMCLIAGLCVVLNMQRAGAQEHDPIPNTEHSGGGQGGTSTSDRSNFAVFGDVGAALPHGSFGNAFNTGFSVNTGLEYMFNSNFSAVGTFGYNRFPFVISSIHTDIYQVSANAKGYLTTPPNKLRPFVNGGVGAYVFSSATVRFGGNIGGGLLYEITPKWGVQGSYNYHIINTSGTVRYSTLQGGVRFRF